MTSIAPVINELLNTHDSRLIQQPPFSIDNLNAFLREAYQIVRAPTLPFTPVRPPITPTTRTKAWRTS